MVANVDIICLKGWFRGYNRDGQRERGVWFMHVGSEIHRPVA